MPCEKKKSLKCSKGFIFCDPVYRGPQGPPGPIGPQGLTGSTGPAGADGADGVGFEAVGQRGDFLRYYNDSLGWVAAGTSTLNNIFIGTTTADDVSITNRDNIALGNTSGQGLYSTTSVRGTICLGQYTGGSGTIFGGSTVALVRDSIAIGTTAGFAGQQEGAISIGVGTNSSYSQQKYSVALGPYAARLGQNYGSIVVGPFSGMASSVSIGGATPVFSGSDATAIPGARSVILGYYSGRFGEGIDAIAIGTETHVSGSGDNSIAIGLYAASGYGLAGNVIINLPNVAAAAGVDAIAIGKGAGLSSQGDSAISVGVFAGSDRQSAGAIAIGLYAASNLDDTFTQLTAELSQGLDSIAIGTSAGREIQGDTAIAIGASAGYTNQGTDSIAIGNGAGDSNQGGLSIAIGANAGGNTQGTTAIAIGNNAGLTTQGDYSICIGNGTEATGVLYGVAIGDFSYVEGNSAVAVGDSTWCGGVDCVAIGSYANAWHEAAIAIGASAVSDYTGGISIGKNAFSSATNGIAIGAEAAAFNASTIVINATGVTLGTTASNTCLIKPVRQVTAQAGAFANSTPPAGFFHVVYNPTTGELASMLAS